MSSLYEQNLYAILENQPVNVEQLKNLRFLAKRWDRQLLPRIDREIKNCSMEVSP